MAPKLLDLAGKQATNELTKLAAGSDPFGNHSNRVELCIPDWRQQEGGTPMLMEGHNHAPDRRIRRHCRGG